MYPVFQQPHNPSMNPAMVPLPTTSATLAVPDIPAPDIPSPEDIAAEQRLADLAAMDDLEAAHLSQQLLLTTPTDDDQHDDDEDFDTMLADLDHALLHQ